MINSSLLLIFLFGCVISIVVFLGVQQSAEWAKALADQQRNDIQPHSPKRESVASGGEPFPPKPAVESLRKP